MPSATRHHFCSLTSLGLYRRMYRPPESHGLYTQEYDTVRRLVQIRYPSGHRRIVRYYNEQGRLRSVVVDHADIDYVYHKDAQTLKSINVSSQAGEHYVCALLYEPDGALVTAHSVQFNGSQQAFIGANFHYTYDRNFRISLVQGRIGTKNMRSVLIGYDPTTGRLAKVSPFAFEYPHTHREIIRDANMEIVREFDRHGRPTDVWYRFNNNIVFTLDVKYDAIGRVHSWRRKVRSSDLKAYEYVYDVDGNVVEVLENSQSTWKYETDANGNIVKIGYYGTVRTVVVNARDQVESSGQESYIYDQDGLLVQRDSEMFEYDSFGQLTRAFQTGKYDIRYAYDGRRRLAARCDMTTGDVLQLFYADLMHDRRITHIYDHSTAKATYLFYDDRGTLFAMQRESDYFYIGLDPFDSPIVILNGVGSVVKQMSYDPLGNRIADLMHEFPFMLGFRGDLTDPVTKLIFTDGRVYDPQLGRWTFPMYDRFIDRAGRLTVFPELGNLYRNTFLWNRPTDHDSPDTGW